MNWISLTSAEQLTGITEKSFERPQLIFKHSTRCNISSMAKNRLERYAEPPTGTDYYYLDLIAHRDISHKVAEDFRVHHESPQVLVIKNGKCVYDESHSAISMDEIAEQLS
ncbi:bacillithiol system redox-active protein YtxJ [Deminuibacter soli]|uniref:Bacillithiol system redox-active protein YtxJ n=1 Tax=Deminuibacter soli TaxID=2291815 RepID=A0A3E1NHZ6_9BACT|nr:bacillithiol system redox-active protein YtxJ [Deminuibacter soli]RFM27556.1 bacillithiol system redox-active protein YtxJ [Deminuibacter soli]